MRFSGGQCSCGHTCACGCGVTPRGKEGRIYASDRCKNAAHARKDPRVSKAEDWHIVSWLAVRDEKKFREVVRLALAGADWPRGRRYYQRFGARD